MSWESCILLLNSDSTGNFYAGDIVTGSVILEFKHEQKIDRIDFEVIGKSKAQWTRSMPTIPYIKIYSQKRKILKYNIDVFTELNGKLVQPGIYSHHFHFVLPDDVPSTFESSVAKVNYYIKVTGKATYKLKKFKITPFEVLSKVNINHMLEYLDPVTTESKKIFWKCGEVSLSIKTYTGFSPKQRIPFEIIIINENKVKISKINVALVQKIHYTVNSGYADDEKKVGTISHTKFSNTVTETCRFEMEIPPTVPSSINTAEPMVDISYVLRIEMKFSYHTSLYEDIPVTVATIPVLHQNFVGPKCR